MEYDEGQDTRMSQLRQPLVNSMSGNRDNTMLANNPTKRISAQVSAGLNRREEVELTHFERPVLDIEGLNNRSRRL